MNRVTLIGAAAISTVAATVSVPSFAAPVHERASVTSFEAQGRQDSRFPDVSADGRFVVFHSRSGNLSKGDRNRSHDVFLRDRKRGTTQRISRTPGGSAPDSFSGQPSITPDGKFILYVSDASNITADGGSSGTTDLYLYNRLTQRTSRVNIAEDDSQQVSGIIDASMSDDANRIAFTISGGSAIYVRDRMLGTTSRVDIPPEGGQFPEASQGAHVSGNGRYVGFFSSSHAYVRDLANGSTEQIDVSSDEVPGESLGEVMDVSRSGRYVLFHSYANNLVPGKQTPGAAQTYVRDRVAGLTTRVSLSGRGSLANDDALAVGISNNGRYVLMLSWATNLVARDSNGDADYFWRDRKAGTTQRVNVSARGRQANGGSAEAAMSTSGTWVVFASEATNLVRGDTNGRTDVFVRRTR